jgi:hypothetical protein
MIKAAVPKWLSRKLLVFLISTVMLCLRIVTEQAWLIVAGIYIGGNILDKIIDLVKSRNA